jgi:RNA polymerase sigma-70 factor, ECF subfamily
MKAQPLPISSRGSVTQWIHDVRECCDQQAAQELFERYFTQLIEQVRSRVNRKVHSVNDAEDVAAFALSEVLCKIRDGSFPDLNDRSGLWALIITIADVRTRHVWRHANQAKRDIKLTISPAQLQSPVQDSTAGAFDFTSHEPTPEFVASVNDQLEQLLCALGSDEYRDLLAWELAGDSPAEIRSKLSERMGQDVSERTVRRKRERMRQELQAIYGKELADSVSE